MPRVALGVRRTALSDGRPGRLSRRWSLVEGILTIVVVVLIVLFVLGYFGRGRFHV
jgi:hypothetical protein